MNQRTVASFVIFTQALMLVVSNCAADEDHGFVPIFDGKSLDGWEEMPASEKPAWRVKDGVIFGDGDLGRGYLVYENHELADFEIKFSYRFPKQKGNSGMNIRAKADATGKRAFTGYHVDLGHVGIGKQVLGAWDFHTPGRREHACFRGDRLVIDKDDKSSVTKIEGAVTADDINKGDWNHVHVVVKGNSFKFSINGKPASEFIEHLPDDKRLHKGMIQLQLHDPGMTVEFKDLRLKVTS